MESREPTVVVTSELHTSQTYLFPKSLPRVPTFFLITPIGVVQRLR